MQAVPTTISQAFPARKQYVIPSYQRNYVWNRSDQWEPLWDDLMTVTQQILSGAEQRAHFLGTIITKEVPTTRFINRWWVVDGQQRLTTLQILMAAACGVFRSRGITSCTSILQEALFNSPNAVQDPADRYKIRHKSRDYQGFSELIEHSLGGPDEPLPDGVARRLRECHVYFRDTLADWLPKKDSVRHAEAITRAILQLLHVVDIYLDGHENAHAIFEALNARGEPLTEWEKTKNYLLSVAVGPGDPDGDSTYEEYLSLYDSDPYWEETVYAPRFSGKRIDLFLFFFAQIEVPVQLRKLACDNAMNPLKRNRLYRDFRYVGERIYHGYTDELLRLLERLNHYAEIYQGIDTASSGVFSTYARLVMQRREALNLASLIPLFMVLVDKVGYGTGLDRALRIVDSYLMRRVALKARYSGFDDVAFGFVQAARDATPDQVYAVLIEQFEQSTWANRWPSNDEIIQHLREADMYNNIASSRKQMLLSGIAEAMHKDRETGLTMPFSLTKPLTVEHVAPQKWERHWRQDLGFKDNEEDRLRLDRLVHRIGNLTVVTEPLNYKLLNHPWSHKAKLLKDDNLEMNRRLVGDMEETTWNEREINRRSQILADYVTRIWPHAAELREELGINSSSRETT